MTWNAPGDAVPIVLDCVAKPGLKVSQVKIGNALRKCQNKLTALSSLPAPGEEEGGRGVRRHVGQLARHREGAGRDLLPESQR